MTAEQLEELAGGVNPDFMGMDHEEVNTSLARRVLAAERLVGAAEGIRAWLFYHSDCALDDIDAALTAYREASK